MVLPSGEKRGESSWPGEEVRRLAVPPFLSAIQISPPYTKVIWDWEMSGFWKSRASTCASREWVIKEQMINNRIFLINSSFKGVLIPVSILNINQIRQGQFLTSETREWMVKKDMH